MNMPKLFFIAAALLFGCIGLSSLFKGGGGESTAQLLTISQPIEIPLEDELRSVVVAKDDPKTNNITQELFQQQQSKEGPLLAEAELPDADRIEDLFRKVEPRLPFVETIIYKSQVPWLQGRAAWISDYASHFKTSRHFIARSLNGKCDYIKQDVAVGDRFNVLRSDLDIRFHLVIDLSRSRLWFYSYCADTDQRILLKSYPVGLGRVDSSQPSGLLTPLGSYTLGDRVAIYKPKQIGWHNGVKTEMIRVFGTRWIPFEQELEGCTAPARGLGLHGIPWVGEEGGVFGEDVESIGKYQSDGCIRLLCKDVEELFSIIITKPTTVQLVRDFFEAKLPGKEWTKE